MGDSPPSESLRVRAAGRPVPDQLVRVISHGHHRHQGPVLRGADGAGKSARGAGIKNVQVHTERIQKPLDDPSPLSP